MTRKPPLILQSLTMNPSTFFKVLLLRQSEAIKRPLESGGLFSDARAQALGKC